MSDQVAGQEPFELAAVRNREDYADALAMPIESTSGGQKCVGLSRAAWGR
jgi:hypothetical protein